MRFKANKMRFPSPCSLSRTNDTSPEAVGEVDALHALIRSRCVCAHAPRQHVGETHTATGETVAGETHTAAGKTHTAAGKTHTAVVTPESLLSPARHSKSAHATKPPQPKPRPALSKPRTACVRVHMHPHACIHLPCLQVCEGPTLYPPFRDSRQSDGTTTATAASANPSLPPSRLP